MTSRSAIYAAHLIEESLGLPAGELTADSVPMDLVGTLEGALAGRTGGDPEQPFLEERIAAFGKELEKESLEKLGFSVRKARWPGEAPFAVCLTHDVDNISRPLSHILRVRNRFRKADFVLALLGLRPLYNNISLVADMETARGLRSSFYLLTGNYSLRGLSGTLAKLGRDGFEVGLHGDFGTHDSQEKMESALALFRSETGVEPQGVREHYLRFDFQKTWRIMENVALDYDSTVGFAERLGFPLGLCTPFHPPDSEWNPMHLLELPLSVMDATLWGYLKRNEADGRSDVGSMVGKVQDVGGLFTLLWHPEAVRMKGGRIYPSILDDLMMKRPFLGGGITIASWWRARAIPMKRENHRLSIRDAPNGLVLQARIAEGRSLRVRGGNVVQSEGRAVVSVDQREFSLEVV